MAPQNDDRDLVITVHGIRTFGGWQNRLYRLIDEQNIVASRRPAFSHYKFGYFDLLKFISPLTRKREVRRFLGHLQVELARERWRRVHIVCHSFGTFLVANALLESQESFPPRIHTLILAGSVLKENFDWTKIIGKRVSRIVNDCGTKDSVLLINKILVPFLGAAGRLGFVGMRNELFIERHFDFGHSGYFETRGKPDDEFMRRYWLPVLVGHSKIEESERKRPTVSGGLFLFLIIHADAIKLAVWALLIFGGYQASMGYLENLRRAELFARASYLATSAEKLLEQGEAENAVRVVLSTLPRSKDDQRRLVSADAFRVMSAAAMAVPQHIDLLIPGTGKTSYKSIMKSQWSDDGRQIVALSEALNGLGEQFYRFDADQWKPRLIGEAISPSWDKLPEWGGRLVQESAVSPDLRYFAYAMQDELLVFNARFNRPILRGSLGTPLTPYSPFDRPRILFGGSDILYILNNGSREITVWHPGFDEDSTSIKLKSGSTKLVGARDIYVVTMSPEEGVQFWNGVNPDSPWLVWNAKIDASDDWTATKQFEFADAKIDWVEHTALVCLFHPKGYGRILLVDITAPEVLATEQIDDNAFLPKDCAFADDDGKRVVVASSKGLSIFDISTKQRKDGESFRNNALPAMLSVDRDRGQAFVALSSGAVELWSLTGHPRRLGQRTTSDDSFRSFRSLELYSPAQKAMVLQSGGELRLWRYGPQLDVQKIGHLRISAPARSMCGRRLVIEDTVRPYRIFSTKTWSPGAVLEGATKALRSTPRSNSGPFEVEGEIFFGTLRTRSNGWELWKFDNTGKISRTELPISIRNSEPISFVSSIGLLIVVDQIGTVFGIDSSTGGIKKLNRSEDTSDWKILPTQVSCSGRYLIEKPDVSKFRLWEIGAPQARLIFAADDIVHASFAAGSDWISLTNREGKVSVQRADRLSGPLDWNEVIKGGGQKTFISDDARAAITVTVGGTGYLWNPSRSGILNAEPLRIGNNIDRARFYSDNTRVALGIWNGQTVIWDLLTKKELYRIELDDKRYKTLDLSDDGRRLLIQDRRRTYSIPSFPDDRAMFEHVLSTRQTMPQEMTEYELHHAGIAVPLSQSR